MLPHIDPNIAPTIMLLSPARLDGVRGQMLLNPHAKFQAATELRSEGGASLAELFSFVSGLYFRGKVAYARAFACAPEGVTAAWVITAGGGLCALDQRVTAERLRGWTKTAIREDNPHFTTPLFRHASELRNTHPEPTRFVLLGSVASKKYVEPLAEIFGDRLLFPTDFVGRGDMSRGSLLLRAASQGQELAYEPVMGASLHRPRRPSGS